ncbi:GAF domain-containing protein [Streptomyces sp. NPDC046939]|uniref:GAF domain-containing protein n=1 Tax=Streptomyces sp. NPDC046939 TaxID=3155376 RepID=UPI003404DAA5
MHNRRSRPVRGCGLRPTAAWTHRVWSISLVDGHTACSQAVESGRAVWVDDVRTSPLFTYDSRQAMLDAGSRAVLSLPLRQPGGPTLGVLSLHHHSPDRLARRADTVVLSALTRAAGRALQRHAH